MHIPQLKSQSGLFLASVGVNLLPLLWFTHLPSADGPSHVYNASLLSRYFLDGSDPIRRFLEFNTSFPPNLLGHGVLALLISVMSPEMAERALVALYVVLLPVALRYALRASSSNTHGIEFLGLAVVFNSHLHWGFYNFLAGIVAYLFGLGYWLRIRGREPAGAELFTMSAALTLVYLCHPVPLLELWITIGILSAGASIRTRSWRLSEWRRAAIVSIPAAALYVHYLLTRPPGLPVPVTWPTLRYSGSLLVRLFPLATYTPAEQRAALALSVILASAAVWAWTSRKARHSNHEYLYASALLAGLMFLAPTQAEGGTLITPRLLYFPLFLFLIWLVSMKWPQPAVTGFVVAGIGLMLVGHVARWPVYERYDERLRNFLALAEAGGANRSTHATAVFFQKAGPGATVSLDERGTPHLSAGAWGYIAARRRDVLLSDYEPLLGYFPFRFRPGADPWPYALQRPADCVPAITLIDKDRYRAESGLEVDEQAVWIEDGQLDQESCIRRYARHLVAVRRSPGGTLFWLDGSH